MMRHITVDFGNTSIKAAVFENDQMVTHYGTLTQVGLLELLNSHSTYKIGISTVSTAATHIYNLIEDKSRLMVLSSSTKLPIQNAYQQPETLGMDRIALVVGAAHLFPKQNALVIDCGTCITYDIITNNNTYLGGAIAPGIKTRFKAMHQYTAKLPLIETPEVTPVLGTSTVSCMQSGVVNGTVAELEGMMARFKKSYSDMQIVLSGGDATFLKPLLKFDVHLAPDLVLVGLNRIMIFNA